MQVVRGIKGDLTAFSDLSITLSKKPNGGGIYECGFRLKKRTPKKIQGGSKMRDFKKVLSVFAFTTLVIIASGFVTSNATAGDCDGESGAAYGLCNAYCEAMDCDGAPQASQTACEKVESKYINITGMSMPCEVPSCQSNRDCTGSEKCIRDARTNIGTCVCINIGGCS